MRDEKKFRWGWILAVLGGVVIAMGCDRGCRDIPEPPKGLEGSYELSSAIPEEATAVVFSAQLAELLDWAQAVSATLPVALPGPGEAAQWEAAGAMLDGPAAAFWVDGQWVVVGWRVPEKELILESMAQGAQPTEVDPGMRGGQGWREYDGERWQRFATSDGRRIARGWSIEPGSTAVDEIMWTREPGEHWAVDADQRRLAEGGGETDQDGAIFGSIDSHIVLDALPREGRAEFLVDHLSERMGRIHWQLSQGDDEHSVVVDVFMPGRTEVPVAVPDLGEARGDLPDIGGLARPGVPAVLRLSVDPEQFLALLRSTLAVDERQRLDETLETLQHELVVDIEEGIIDNITGQMAVVIFGLEDAFFEAQGLDLVASIARLESTREAVIVPIEDRDLMEEVLDAFTQLSQGGLRRQAMEHTIQYAWFDDGALEWAVILSDDHLAIVDSMVAFDHVGSWERSPRTLDATLADRGVEDMMRASRGVALYLDVATVRGIVKEGGNEVMARWLEPVEALRLESDIGGEKGLARMQLWMSDRAVEEE